MKDKNDREYLSSLIGGFRLTQCIYVVAKLQISEALINRSLSVNELSKITKTSPDALYRVLQYLSKHGIFNEVADRVFVGTELSELLIKNNKHSLRPMAILNGEEFYHATSALLHSVITNEPCFEQIFKQDFWHYLLEHKSTSQSFNDAMEKGSNLIIKRLLSCYDFSDAKNIVDIAGGKGHVVASILFKYKNIKGTVFDLPQLEDNCNEYIKKKRLIFRCKFVGGDLFQASRLPRGDIYILKTIIHDWDDKAALKILELCSSSMGKNDTLLIIDRIINDDGVTPTNTYMWDIHMLAILGGRERNIKEFYKLLEQARLKLMNTICLNKELYLLEVKK